MLGERVNTRLLAILSKENVIAASELFLWNGDDSSSSLLCFVVLSRGVVGSELKVPSRSLFILLISGKYLGFCLEFLLTLETYPSPDPTV